MILILIIACHTAPDPSEPCGIEDGPADASCTPHPCAIDCTSREEAVACCIRTEGFGVVEPWLDHQLDGCSSGVECDPNHYLSAGAALCIAQVYGLKPDVGGCVEHFMVGDVLIDWRVTSFGKCNATEIKGTLEEIDAVDGAEVAQGYEYVSVTKCK